MFFSKAQPVWIEGEERKLNCQLVLKATADFTNAKLYIAVNSFYRLTINGQFVAFGPARTARGYARVDEIDLSAFGVGEMVIETVGYACRSLSTVYEPSFVTAEVRRGDEVLLATGYDFDGFTSHRLEKVKRYSVQRHFGEVWDYTLPISKVTLALQPAPKYIGRVAPYAKYDYLSFDCAVEKGEYEVDESRPFRERFSFSATEYWGTYSADEIYGDPTKFVAQSVLTEKEKNAKFPLMLEKGQYAIVDFRQIETGFLSVKLKAEQKSDVILAFTEVRQDEFFTAINAHNTIEIIADGESDFYSFEPYVCRFVAILVKSGKITLSSLGVRTFERDMTSAKKVEIDDEQLREIYNAGVRTFAHNALDLYFDCPSRERAGWLCDSWFTGKVEHFLLGETPTEDAFLENYRLFDGDDDIIDGFLPMCYPSDMQLGNKFIPQWNMWYILEVCEYLTERNEKIDKELYRASVKAILDALARYETEEGLLCRLPSWNFVEWSTANQWTNDINWPTNALYCEVLEKAGELYGYDELVEKARRLRPIVVERAFDGELFVDNAIETDGKFVNTTNSSEACQYYIILFCNPDLNDKKYAKLNGYVRDGFTSFDTSKKPFVEVNAFIGFYLKMCALQKLGLWDELARDCKKFFGGMVEKTNTLWEYKTVLGSQDHGFASYATIAIDAIAKNLKK